MSNLKNLKTKKGRDESGLFVVEGEKFIEEIPAQYTVRHYLATQKFADENNLDRYKNRARVEIIRDSVFNGIADTVSPQGIMAVCEQISHTLPQILQPDGFILLGENINDPGNMGTLVRTAAAAGACGAVFTRGSCDVFAPKVLRAAAGAVLRLPIVANTEAEDAFAFLKSEHIPVFAAHPRGDALPYELNLRKNFCILIGNETHGISQTAKNCADALVRLPMTNTTESLNASVAGSILLYEAVRQRLDLS